jgi:hypothetical protein
MYYCGRNYKTAHDFYKQYNSSIPSSNLIKEIPSEPIQEQQLNMKWSTFKYASSSNPEVWGPAFWFTLHNGAVNYPLQASPITSERMKNYILGMPVMIPCETCKEHATSHIEANYNKLDDICSGRMKLFNFFVDFHNLVNKRYGKPIMSYEDAYKLYTGGVTLLKLSY